MPSILYPPTINWGFLFQRPQQLMSQFAKNGWQVYYANKTQRYKEVEEVQPNLFIYHDFTVLLNKIKEVDVLYISSPKQYYLSDKIKSKLIIYDCIDKFPEWGEYEDLITEKADIIFTSSQYLYEEKKKVHKNVFLIRNACEYEHLQLNTCNEVPIELSRLKRPIVAMIGALGSWIDNEILLEVAKKYTTVLIGLEFGSKIPEGVINLGTKSYEKLPFYYNNIDLGIIPFDQSLTSRAANPIKMYEYLAAGKATVASDLPEMKVFPELIYNAKTADDFILKINKALNEDNEKLVEERKKIARQNTWALRFGKITSILGEFL